MKRIGLIAAMTDELNAFLEKFGGRLHTETCCGKTVLIAKNGSKEIYITESGVGEIFAAAAAQHLITKYGVEAIINFGVCGSLLSRHGLKKTVLIGGVVHYEMDTSAIDGIEPGRYAFLPSAVIPLSADLIQKALKVNPALETVICASGNKFIADEKDKNYLSRTFGADVCEMEAAGIVLTCSACNVPCLMIKAVSDGEGGAEDFRSTVSQAARVYIDLIINLLETV